MNKHRNLIKPIVDIYIYNNSLIFTKENKIVVPYYFVHTYVDHGAASFQDIYICTDYLIISHECPQTT